MCSTWVHVMYRSVKALQLLLNPMKKEFTCSVSIVGPNCITTSSATQQDFLFCRVSRHQSTRSNLFNMRVYSTFPRTYPVQKKKRKKDYSRDVSDQQVYKGFKKKKKIGITITLLTISFYQYTTHFYTDTQYYDVIND